MDSNGIKTCAMCTQASSFAGSINNDLISSILITKVEDKHFLNVFISTKEGNQNIGGTGYGIKFCPWCGRELDIKIRE